MEKDVADAIADIKKRLEYQERAHKDIVETETGGKNKETGMTHGIVTGLPVMMLAIFLSAYIAWIVSTIYARKS